MDSTMIALIAGAVGGVVVLVVMLVFLVRHCRRKRDPKLAIGGEAPPTRALGRGEGARILRELEQSTTQLAVQPRAESKKQRSDEQKGNKLLNKLPRWSKRTRKEEPRPVERPHLEYATLSLDPAEDDVIDAPDGDQRTTATLKSGPSQQYLELGELPTDSAGSRDRGDRRTSSCVGRIIGERSSIEYSVIDPVKTRALSKALNPDPVDLDKLAEAPTTSSKQRRFSCSNQRYSQGTAAPAGSPRLTRHDMAAARRTSLATTKIAELNESSTPVKPIFAKTGSKPLLSDLKTAPWYHPNLPAKYAEQLLRLDSQMIRGSANGLFMVRSTEDGGETKYFLSVVHDSAVHHFEIQWDQEAATFFLGFLQFPSLSQLVAHLSANEEGEIGTRLTKVCERHQRESGEMRRASVAGAVIAGRTRL
eukprot:m.104580 g.104580  ORF g.104580 m.104580 type:complete len:420 (+) comp9106_c0_seq2:132-1391(+)